MLTSFTVPAEEHLPYSMMLPPPYFTVEFMLVFYHYAPSARIYDVDLNSTSRITTILLTICLINALLARPVTLGWQPCFSRFAAVPYSFSDDGLNRALRDVRSLRYCFINFKCLPNFISDPSGVFFTWYLHTTSGFILRWNYTEMD